MEKVTIIDYGREEYLDGAEARFAMYEGEYPSGDWIAFCNSLETARILANALSATVILDTST